MQCPRCGVALERKTVRGRSTEIDRCPTCGGIWFDDGEIAELLGIPRSAIRLIPADASTTKLLCPRCKLTLHIFAYPGTMTVVEGCRQCGGIRLDAGEFEEIRRSQRTSRMECPKCGHEQTRADTCAQCGVIMNKATSVRTRPETKSAPPALHAEIAGVKGTLIRFIDRSLSAMLQGIRQG
jgi:uncharacterized protein